MTNHAVLFKPDKVTGKECQKEIGKRNLGKKARVGKRERKTTHY